MTPRSVARVPMRDAKASTGQFVERSDRRDRRAVVVDHDVASGSVAIQVSLRRVAAAATGATADAGEADGGVGAAAAATAGDADVAGSGADTAAAAGVAAGPRRAGFPTPCGCIASTIASMIEIPGGGRRGPGSRHPVPGACGTGGAASAAARCSSSDFGRPPPGYWRGLPRRQASSTTPTIAARSSRC